MDFERFIVKKTDEEEEYVFILSFPESRRRWDCGKETKTEWTSEGERKRYKKRSMGDGVIASP